jgi:predicted dehydrogenase
LGVNVAVVGLGKMGILHSGIVNSFPGAQVKAVCEKESYLAKVGRALLPDSISFYTDHSKMIEKEELDAVYITTPISTHLPLIIDFARGNDDVSLFVEKPLAATGEMAQQACDAVKDSRGVHMVGFQKHFSQVFLKARKIIQQGTLGELMFFRSSAFSSDVLREGTSWRFSKGSGGVLLDLAPHLIDLLLWFFGEPKTVVAVKRRIFSSEVEDYVHATLSFTSGLTGHLDACWSMRDYRLPEVMIDVYGKQGVLSVTDDFVRYRLDKENSVTADGNLLYRQSFNTSVPFLLAEPEYTKESQAFLASVEKKSLPECNFFEAMRVNRLIDRINESAR